MAFRLLLSALLPLHGTSQAIAPPGILQVAADVSSVVLAAILALLLLAMLVLLVQLRKLIAALRQQVRPVADRARVAAENVEYISAMVREDVQKIHSSVAGLSDRLKDASERMEERVEEFNALMDVVQDETESVLLDTAAAVRGVRVGARIMGEGVASDGEPSPRQGHGASDESDESEGAMVPGDAESE